MGFQSILVLKYHMGQYKSSHIGQLCGIKISIKDPQHFISFIMQGPTAQNDR